MYVHFFKRLFDLIIAILALPLILLLIAILGPIIYFEDKGPVFYNAPRVGKDGKEFIMYKFRSMKVNAPDLTLADGSTYNGADDPRMTKIGAFMRRTSLDEFPQFLNVLIGNMSVIGPRPDLKRETELYEGNEGEKLLVKPGITGLAQISGCRGETDTLDKMEMRIKFDLKYIQYWSLWLDLKIIFLTVFKGFVGASAY